MKISKSNGVLFSVLFVSCQMGYSQNVQIEYIFSEDVNRSIDERIASYKENPEWKFYLTINRILFEDDCGNYQLLVGSYKDQPIEVIASLINRSVHYYQSGSLKVPVIFDYDYAFTGYGTDSKGRAIRKNVTGNGYVIEFAKNGKVVREGN